MPVLCLVPEHELQAQCRLRTGLESRRRSRAEIRDRVRELVGRPDRGGKYPAQLSGGQQQRIALARAIATSPGLLLLDEPLSALDAKVRARLRHEVKALQRRLGVTTIMVTHDQEEALTMADRIVVMNGGVIEQAGTPTGICREPAGIFVAGCIGAMNFIAGEVTGAGEAAGVPPARTATAADRGSVFEATVEYLECLGSFARAELGSHGGAPADGPADRAGPAPRRAGAKHGAGVAPRDAVRIHAEARPDG